MLDEVLQTKLRDPAYCDWHFAALRSLQTVDQANWYDAVFLQRLEIARDYLAAVNPAAMATFTSAFDRLKPPDGFRIAMLDNVFDRSTHARILEISRAIKAGDSQIGRSDQWETDHFGRRVIWDHPCFLELQQNLLGKVSALAECELRVGYNFLSLYGGSGRCAPHMDAPVSMYTLDYCIEQSDEWPIFFSKLVDWPTAETFRHVDANAIKRDADLAFTPYVLQPNQALFFNGSSQWHYRENIAPGGFCDLLFFHYYPAGCENLIEPAAWHRYFDIPELDALCDLFAVEDAHEREALIATR